MKKQFIYIGVLVLMGQLVKAQILFSTKTITTAVPSLRVYADARAAGMANVGLATSADANSVFINFAKTAFASSDGEIGINYTPWMENAAPGMYMGRVSGYKKIGERQAIGGAIRYFNLGAYELHDANGVLIQTSRPNDLLLDVGYARKLSEKFAIGIVLRYMRSVLFSGTVSGTTYRPANGVAGDLSVFYNGLTTEGQGFTGGFALSNMGTKVGYVNDASAKEFIPANAGLGGAYTYVLGEDHKVIFGADFNKLLVPAFPDSVSEQAAYHKMGVLESYGKSFDNGDWRLSAGMEYVYHEQFSIRGGYLVEHKNLAGRNGFTAGVGVKLFDGCRLNVGYIAARGSGVSRNPLSNTLLFGLLFDFGKKAQ